MSDSSAIQETVLLIQRAQGDDSQALEELFERYLPRVRRVAALRLGKSHHELLDVDDLTQEAMTDAFRGLQSFSISSDATFLNWLSTVVENRIRMAWRARNAQKRGGGKEQRFADAQHSVHDSHLQGASPTPSQHAVASELSDRMEAGLQKVSERSREVIIQRFFCRMSYDEIAASMELAGASTARSLYSRALKELESFLEPGDDTRL